MNWGHKIGIVYGSFAVFILGLVYVCTQQKDIFLVSKEYYKDEINYQQRIDSEHNAKKENIGIEQTSDMLQLHWSKGQAEGSVLLFRPSDANQDLTLPLSLDSTGNQNIPISTLPKGLWRVKLEWRKGDKSYYQEKTLTL